MIGSTKAANIALLTPVWERVLGRSPIGIDDDFFDLGGNAASATRLFAEVAQDCGVRLRATMICEAPTIAAVAELLEHSSAPKTSPLVLLKSGTGKLPVFITHGIGGNIIDFVPLARRLQLQQPIYGLQARGNDDGAEPLQRIEDMAQDYLEAMKRVQPTGPYFLMGYSLGGLIMLEMTQRLTASGEKVSLLALVETHPHSRYVSLNQRGRMLMRKVGRRAAFWRKRAVGAPVAPETRRAIQAGDLAWARYRPRFYQGRIDFIGAETVTCFPDNSAGFWRKMAAECDSEVLPGDHVGIVTTQVEHLAFALTRRAQAALRRTETTSQACND
jgi:thioesterase domain-containing protein